MGEEKEEVLEGEIETPEGMGEKPPLEGSNIDITEFIKPGDIEKGKTELTPEQMEMFKKMLAKGNI